MRDKKLYRLQWSQIYTNWPKTVPQEPKEKEITDFTEAREVLSRIMAK